jgi:REP element-mobilizing transposase RayT
MGVACNVHSFIICGHVIISMVMKNFRKKYKTKSMRAAWWDYSANGVYFVTICTQNRRNYFGQVKRGKMCLSEIGWIAHNCWAQIPDHFLFVKLGDFMIMPNHVHGIIAVNKLSSIPVGTLPVAGTLPVVGTLHATFLQSRQKMSEISPKSNSVSAAIRSYKSAVSNQARKINNTFGWQSRFHDRIVRNNPEYQRIARYIINNPQNWPRDRNFS